MYTSITVFLNLYTHVCIIFERDKISVSLNYKSRKSNVVLTQVKINDGWCGIVG